MQKLPFRNDLRLLICRTAFLLGVWVLNNSVYAGIVEGEGASSAAAPASEHSIPVGREQVAALLFGKNFDYRVDSLRALGPEVLPAMAELYIAGDEQQRTRIAWGFYSLGWKSAAAEQVLMRDVHTQNPQLRLQVQWALGRVSDAPEVVDVLLQNMQYDQNPLFRDKAACALAYDQIHLNDKQKLRLFEGLIGGLESDNPKVRAISLQALQIHVGQSKDFDPNAPQEARAQKIQEWKQWLEEYRATL